MDQEYILQLLQAVQTGDLKPEEALHRLRLKPFEDLTYAKVDHHRSLRQGSPEVIYGSGKQLSQIQGILKSLLAEENSNILITRLSSDMAAALQQDYCLEYHATARMGIVNKAEERELRGSIVVASGGTSDISVAEEAVITAETLGSKVHRLYDVGVAGIHRLLTHLELLSTARVVVAVAGMEGALPSVIGGLVSCPVIAVPTSVGYGANFQGLAALLAMLNSCACGISVVNIDNGFGAGFLAHRINMMESI